MPEVGLESECSGVCTALMKAARHTYPQNTSEFSATIALLVKHAPSHQELMARDLEDHSATQLCVMANKPHIAAQVLSRCCGCEPSPLPGCGLSGYLPGWGIGTKLDLIPKVIDWCPLTRGSLLLLIDHTKALDISQANHRADRCVGCRRRAKERI